MHVPFEIPDEQLIFGLSLELIYGTILYNANLGSFAQLVEYKF
jgi:hypothetical protein